MKIGVAVARLAATHAFSTQDLAGLSRLSQQSDPASLQKFQDEIIKLFDALDAKTEKTPADADAMELLATLHDDATELAASAGAQKPTAPPLPTFASLNARKTWREPRPQSARVPYSQAKRGILLDERREKLVDTRQLADSFSRIGQRLSGMLDGARITVASADWRDLYPENQRLGTDAFANTARMADVQGLLSRQSLAASGGVCGPLQVDFDIPFFATSDRPLRNGLPAFRADRGGVQFVPPAVLNSASAGIAVWTEATDANPGGATKPVATLSCPDVTEVYVDAVPTRIQMGNMQNRFAPEVVQNYVETALAYSARVQDLNLLSHISSYSTKVSSGQLLGAARDLLATFDQAAAAYRYRNRIPRTQGLSLLLPDWCKDLCRADIARQMATSTADDDPLAVTDARIESWFSARQLSPIWLLDGQAAVTGTMASVAQTFGAQSANSALLGWPTQLVWWLYAEGTFQLLDGGMMEFGAIRDSTLNATNQMEMFTEVFESVAFRGLESLQVISSIRPNGASAGTVTTATSPNVY